MYNNIAHNINEVKERLAKSSFKCLRAPESVTLLAVSKKHPADAIRLSFKAGQSDFGENYVQEALEKMADLHDLPLTWHFIGPIQSNKTRAIAEHFSWVHSVDKLKLAQRLSDQRPADLPDLSICLQVNIDREEQKSGFQPEDVASAAETIAQLPKLRLRGLMCIPNPRKLQQFKKATAGAQQGTCHANAFQDLKQLQGQLKTHPKLAHLDTLSMGMSDDFELAIAAGATIVRVGTALFGPRPHS